jgi:hypothetical protein
MKLFNSILNFKIEALGSEVIGNVEVQEQNSNEDSKMRIGAISITRNTHFYSV